MNGHCVRVIDMDVNSLSLLCIISHHTYDNTLVLANNTMCLFKLQQSSSLILQIGFLPIDTRDNFFCNKKQKQKHIYVAIY